MINPNVDKLPRHLQQFVIDQNYASYTPENHAVWRYVMRQSYNFLKNHAHESYVDGLRRTGIGIESIPRIEAMNDILQKIGWGAVCVDGFIPPAAFMEFQAHRVLVIAADIRQINHVEYTPAPDILHEAAGHAPIIADSEYSEYLRRFGEYGAKAISSGKDMELYQAIRHLSILKEAPNSSAEEIAQAQVDVEYKQKNLGEPSEMALISRLHWWTVEFGLIGDIARPKIYGAGLLSSIGESYNCLTEKVKKIPYTLEAKDLAFDITRQQPSLFVTPDFQQLIDVLEQFADTMAFRTGGMEGLNKTIDCGGVCSCRFSSGLELSGCFTEAIAGNDGRVIFIRTKGKSALAYRRKELPGLGKEYFCDGFCSALGKLSSTTQPIESMNEQELQKWGIVPGVIEWKLESGILVKGHLQKIERHQGKNILFRFSEAKVYHREKLLFEGPHCMAIAQTVDSVFFGAADKDAYEQIALVPKERTIKIDYDEKDERLHYLYLQVRNYRENQNANGELTKIWRELKKDYTDNWLLPMEILELVHGKQADLENEIKTWLQQKSQEKQYAKLIADGLSLVYS